MTACTEKPKPETPAINESLTLSIDSQKIKVDTLINQLNREMNAHEELHIIPFPVYNPLDSIKYWSIDGVPVRVSAALSYPEKIEWPMYYIQNGEIIYVRYRFWSKPAPSYATEHMLYINDGKTFYCQERRMDLGADQPPALLREKLFNTCTETPGNIEETYKLYWSAIQPYLDRN